MRTHFLVVRSKTICASDTEGSTGFPRYGSSRTQQSPGCRSRPEMKLASTGHRRSRSVAAGVPGHSAFDRRVLPCLQMAARTHIFRFLAEREGFEPPIGLHLCRISSAVHSTTLPPLQTDEVVGLIARPGQDRSTRLLPLATQFRRCASLRRFEMLRQRRRRILQPPPAARMTSAAVIVIRATDCASKTATQFADAFSNTHAGGALAEPCMTRRRPVHRPGAVSPIAVCHGTQSSDLTD